jgi:hypothetical protein
MQYFPKTKRPFPFIELCTKGWTMVFKLIAGIPGRPSTLWNMRCPSNEYSLEALNKKNNLKNHYKNKIVQNWNLFKPTQVQDVFIAFRKKFITLVSQFKFWFYQSLHAMQNFGHDSLQLIISLICFPINCAAY